MGDPGPLAACARGELPANVALMHLLIGAGTPADAEQALAEALARAGDGAAEARLARVRDLWRANPGAWALVRDVIDGVDHGAPGGPGAVSAIGAAFDRVAALAPEAGAALYALGDPALLEAATAEIVAWLRARQLVGPATRVLDIGCGIGRVEAALAPEVADITGTDVSGRMVEEAASRLAGLANVRVVQVTGRDLAGFADNAFDLVLAVDSFPYLVQAGPSLAEAHIREAARVLAPGGSLVILNYSYRGDPAADRADLAIGAAAHGLDLAVAGERPFALWDGLAFHLAKRD